MCSLSPLIWSLLFVYANVVSSGEQLPDPVEYCQWEIFNATCDLDHIVVMTHAQYGRMRLGRCLTTDVYIGCGGDVISQLDVICSGRHSCQLQLPDSSLHQSQPCPKDMMAYLEASYSCTKVATLPDGQICGDRDPPILRDGSGMLSSQVALRTGYGLPGCPWILEVSKGQKIRITLYDFSLVSRYKTESWYSMDTDREYCYVYAVIRERILDKEFTVCAGHQRETLVYLSSGSHLEIIILDIDKDNAQNFVFKYEAVGCPDVEPPDNAYVIRQRDGATITCNNSHQAWHLVCKDTQWIGQYGKCITGSPSNNGEESKPLPSYGLILAVLIGVAIGIIVGFTLLATVLWCRRGRYKRSNQEEPPQSSAGTLPLSASNPGSPHCKVNRLKAEYGYTHVWQLESGAPRLQTAPDATYQIRKPAHGSGEGTMVCFHPKKDHEYESPKMETFGVKRKSSCHLDPMYQGRSTLSRPKVVQCGDSLDNVVHIEVGLDTTPHSCGPVSSCGGQLPAAYSMASDVKSSICDVAADAKGNHYT